MPVILLLAGVALLLSCIKSVGENESAIVEHLGEFSRVLSPGHHIIIPFIETITYVNKRTQPLETGNVTVYTSDNHSLQIESTLKYRITNEYKVLYEVEQLNQSIHELIKEAVKQYYKTVYLEDLFPTFSLDEQHIVDFMNGYLTSYGLSVTDYSHGSLKPSLETQTYLNNHFYFNLTNLKKSF